MPVKLKPAKRGDLVASSFLSFMKNFTRVAICVMEVVKEEVMDLMPFGRTGGVGSWFVEREGAGGGVLITTSL